MIHMKPCSSNKTKKNIYVAHSKSMDYKKEIYEPFRNSPLNEACNIVLPHEHSDKPFNSREFLKDCEYMIAEVSHKSTGLGVEMGWADAYGTVVLCFHKEGVKPSESIKEVAYAIIEYSESEGLLTKVLESFPLLLNQTTDK